MPQGVPHLFHRATEVALGASFNTQSQVPDILSPSSCPVFSRHTTSFQVHSKDQDMYSLHAYTEDLLVSPNAQAQDPDDPSQTEAPDIICCRCARLWKSSRLLSTPKIKFLMIFTSRIPSVLHVLSPKIRAIAVKYFQGYPRIMPSRTFPFN